MANTSQALSTKVVSRTISELLFETGVDGQSENASCHTGYRIQHREWLVIQSKTVHGHFRHSFLRLITYRELCSAAGSLPKSKYLLPCIAHRRIASVTRIQCQCTAHTIKYVTPTEPLLFQQLLSQSEKHAYPFTAPAAGVASRVTTRQYELESQRKPRCGNWSSPSKARMGAEPAMAP